MFLSSYSFNIMSRAAQVKSIDKTIFMPYVENMNDNTRTVGYARVSTGDQDTQMQIKALTDFGVDGIIEETASGGTMNRKGMKKLWDTLRPGDTLVIWKLDRLGRDVRGIWEAIDRLKSMGVELKVLMEAIDTTSSGGRMLTTLMAALAQMEREQISERTKAGIDAKRAAGVLFGRQHSIKDNPKRLEAMRPYVASGEAAHMRPHDALAILNSADRKAKPIESHETFRRWRRDGFPGIE